MPESSTAPTASGRHTHLRARLTAKLLGTLLLVSASSAALAQDVRYSWFEIAYVEQDVGQSGSITDTAISQTVDISTTDGSGIKFRGSLGTWNNLFTFVDFNSSDINVDAVVSNNQAVIGATDVFDFTAIRGGVGLKWSLTPETDIYGAISYDSTDLDFGSFAGENFDTNDSGIGGTVGVRSMFRDKIELRAHVRYSGVGDVDLNTGAIDTDTLYGVGIGYELVRGLSITGDYESGVFDSWSIGFRLDLDED